MAVAVGIESELAATVKVALGEGVAGVVAERATPLLGVVKEETFLSVPIATERGVEGILNFTERHGARPYTTEDLPRATMAAAHIGELMQFDRLVLRDSLTGLHNRGALDEALESEIARSDRLHKRFALVFLDLDNLKEVNDEFGHHEGDEMLQAVGHALEAVARPYDMAVRYGGDEFVLLLTDLDETEGLTVQDIKLRITESLRMTSQRRHVPIAASMGIAFWPADGRTAKDVMATADARMYQDKRSRRTMRNMRTS